MGFAGLVFHETSHYTGFKNQKLNNLISYSVMSPNVTTEDWKYQHNYLHHSFTNTDYDDDYAENQLLLRHSNKHVHYFHHKFQFIYAFLLFILGAFSKGPYNSIKNNVFSEFMKLKIYKQQKLTDVSSWKRLMFFEDYNEEEILLQEKITCIEFVVMMLQNLNIMEKIYKPASYYPCDLATKYILNDYEEIKIL
jgi:hypothetical protein